MGQLVAARLVAAWLVAARLVAARLVAASLVAASQPASSPRQPRSARVSQDQSKAGVASYLQVRRLDLLDSPPVALISTMAAAGRPI